jgi:glycosyltransferase involved in cell wall biosynthesis
VAAWASVSVVEVAAEAASVSAAPAEPEVAAVVVAALEASYGTRRHRSAQPPGLPVPFSRFAGPVMADPQQVSVIIPACNEASAIATVIGQLNAAARWKEIIVIDDGSTDGTSAAASAAGAHVIRHPYNKGNGAAVKTGIRAASGEFILIIDGDGQHKPSDAVAMAARLGEYDLVVGARSAGTQAGSTRRFGNAALNWLAGFLAGREIPDLTSGFRCARRDYLIDFIHLLPNGFSTPTTTTLAFLKAGHNVAFHPIEALQRVGASKIQLSKDGPKFLLIILRVVTIFSPLRVFLPIAAAAFLVGAAYGVWTVFTQSHVTNTSVLLITLSVVVFLIGLVSEQISAMRIDGRR